MLTKKQSDIPGGRESLLQYPGLPERLISFEILNYLVLLLKL
jgi:hypothetical protein